MVVKWLFSCLILLFGLAISYAQKLSNVLVRQEQSSIIVSYNIDTKTPCKIALYVSINGGTTWQGPLKKVNGDVGLNVSSGSKAITWSVLEEFEELRGNDIKFQVRAEEINFETVKIGKQVWTKYNLNVSTYRNGDIIPEVKDPTEWAKLTTGAWCYYNNDPKNGKIYGKLYNWYAVNDPRGLVPEGYHVPTDNEWDTLITYLGGENIAGGKLKETGTLHWERPNADASNASNFTGLPGGCRSSSGTFNRIGGNGFWWSSSEGSAASALYRDLDYDYGGASSYDGNKECGVSVRCLRD